jgi:hypothetical protein
MEKKKRWTIKRAGTQPNDDAKVILFLVIFQ